MKHSWRYSVAAAAVLMLCLPVLAQQEVNPQPDAPGIRVDVNRSDDVDRNNNAETRKDKADLPLRASHVIGMEVKNYQDEDLGSIEDLVIDPKSGKVRYAAVSMGGFLGLGDELFAVPWGAIKCHKNEDGDYVALLNVDKARMENAKGFNEDNWPDFGDQNWVRENDKRYDVEVDINDKIRVNTNRNNNSRLPNVEVERDR